MSESLKNKTLSGVFWGFMEKFSVQIISFIQGVILARLLTPADFGLVAMVGVFTAVSGALADSGFASALIRKKNKEEIDYSTVFDINLVLSFFLMLVLMAFSKLIADFYHEPVLVKIVCLNAILLFLGSCTGVQWIRMTSNLQFRKMSEMSIINSFFTGILSISLAYCGFGVWSLIYPGFFTIVLNFFLYWHFQHWLPGFKFSWKSCKELFGFGSKMLATVLLSTICDNLSPIIIGKKYNKSDLGYYSRGVSFSQLPSTTITGVLAKVAYPILSEIQDDDERLGKAYRKLLRLSAFLVFPIMMGLAALAHPIIRVMITSKWEPAVVYLQLLCFSLMWYPIHALNLNLLKVKGRSDWYLKLEIIKRSIGILVLFITVPISIFAMCIGQVITSYFSLFINTHYTGKILSLDFLAQMRDLLPSFFYSLSMGGLVYLLSSLFDNDWLKIIVGIIFGVTYYFFVSFIFKSKELSYLLDLVKSSHLIR